MATLQYQIIEYDSSLSGRWIFIAACVWPAINSIVQFRVEFELKFLSDILDNL